MSTATIELVTSATAFLDTIECADCGTTRTDLLACDACDVRDCTVETPRCDDPRALCDDCRPAFCACPTCRADYDNDLRFDR